MANNIVIFDANGAQRIIATVDDGSAHRQRTLANLIAIIAGVDPAAVAAGVFTDPSCDTQGFPYVNAGHPNIQTYRNRYTANVPNVAIVSPASGHKLKFIGYIITTANANLDDIDVQLGFGTSVNDASLFSHPGIGTGAHIALMGINKTGANNEPIRLTVTKAGSGAITCDVVCVYVQVPA